MKYSVIFPVNAIITIQQPPQNNISLWHNWITGRVDIFQHTNKRSFQGNTIAMCFHLRIMRFEYKPTDERILQCYKFWSFDWIDFIQESILSYPKNINTCFMVTSSNGVIFRVTGPVRGIHRSPGNSPHEGHWRRALMFSLMCAWTNGWLNNRDAGDWRLCRTHYDVTVRWCQETCLPCQPQPYRSDVHKKALLICQKVTNQRQWVWSL